MNTKNKFEIKITILILITAVMLMCTSCGPGAYEKQEQTFKYRIEYVGGTYEYTNSIEKDSLSITYTNEYYEQIWSPIMNIKMIVELNKEKK